MFPQPLHGIGEVEKHLIVVYLFVRLSHNLFIYIPLHVSYEAYTSGMLSLFVTLLNPTDLKM